MTITITTITTTISIPTTTITTSTITPCDYQRSRLVVGQVLSLIKFVRSQDAISFVSR